MEKQRTSTIEFFWNNAKSGIGGFFSASINRMPNVDSVFFIDFYDTPKLRKLTVNNHLELIFGGKSAD